MDHLTNFFHNHLRLPARAQDFVRARLQSGANVSLPEHARDASNLKEDHKGRGGERLIGSSELRKMIPFSDAHFWRLEQAGKFSRRVKIGQRRVGWDLDEAVQWVETRKAQRVP